MAFCLRPATAADARLLWAWRNEPEVRRQSFAVEAIAWDTHVGWLTQKLAAAETRIWILEEDGRPAGQVRYERTGDSAEVSVSVAGAARGRGVGRALLVMSAPVACRELGLRVAYGLVKESNHASLRAFERAGFRRTGTTEVAGERAARFEYVCYDAEASG